MLFDSIVKNFSVEENQSLKHVLAKLQSSKIKFCCITSSEGKLIGVLSYGDIVNHLSSGGLTIDAPVCQIMNRNFASAAFKSDHASLKALLSKHRFVPLVDELRNLKALAYGKSNNREFKLSTHKISEQQDYILIAEIGNNHNGSLDLAYDLINAAKDSGANIVKFQMRDLESLYGDNAKSADLSTEYVINLLRKFSLESDDMYRCFDYCHKVGVTPLCTPFDHASLARLEEYGIEGYKIASADLTNTQLYEAIIKTGKPIIASTGMSTDEEIDKALSLLERSNVNFALCHANSTYPTPYADVHLNYLKNLKERTTAVLGYSGHERGWHVSAAAFALGAQVIEKHFTLDKSMEGNDHKVSLLPDEFRMLSSALQNISEALGVGYKRAVTQGEANNKVALAKSIFCKKYIGRGQIITPTHLEIRSPGNGLSPQFYTELLGKVASRDIEPGSSLYHSDLSTTSEVAGSKCPQHFVWSIPVRHRDVYNLIKVFCPPSVEFHLSFKDLEISDEDVLTHRIGGEVIVHAPEQFDSDFVIDLFSVNEDVASKSIVLLNTVFRKAEKIISLLSNQDDVKVIVNCGGHSEKEFIEPAEVERRIELFHARFKKLELGKCRFLAQTMPPYPWHFGGQSFHNQFTSANNILDILSRGNDAIELCLDISHSYMWCNFSDEDFLSFVDSIIHKVAHIHISDAAGVSSEGLQIGLGDIDFSLLRDRLLKNSKNMTLLPEIWQGHENSGEGFRLALHRLFELGY